MRIFEEVMLPFSLGALVAVNGLFWLADQSWAQEAPTTAFDEFLADNSPPCIPVADIEAKAAAFVPMTQEQFRFVQALYVLIPPVDHKLPVGDKGELLGDADGHTLAVLVDGDKACARIKMPPFIAQMLDDVKSGKVEHQPALGDPT